VLHGLLTLDREADVVVPFVEDETLEAVLLGEAVEQAFAVLPCARGETAWTVTDFGAWRVPRSEGPGLPI
jgi:hypothetical protein